MEKFKPEQRLYHAIEYFFVTESSFYEIPFSSNFEYPAQLNRIKMSVDSYLRSNEYIDEKRFAISYCQGKFKIKKWASHQVVHFVVHIVLFRI